MASVINSNVSSLLAQRNLSKSQSMMEQSLQRLSSGMRIVSAKDDSAGMSISERMTAQIKGLDQATRNSNDGISLAQTAEGGLNDVATALQRLRELAVQSSNATNTALDRQAIQEEADQLIGEIDRIATRTDFNGVKLLDGSFERQEFQVGANANETMGVSIASARTSELGVTNTASVNSRQEFGTQAELSGKTLNQGDLVLNGVTIGSSQDGYDTASSVLKAESAIAKAAAINKHTAETGVTAEVNETVAKGEQMTGANAGTATMAINGVSITVSTSTNTAATRQAVVDAINAKSGQTGVIAEDGGDDDAGVVLRAADGRNIQVSYGAGATGVDSASTGVQSGITLGSYTLTSNADIKIGEGSGDLNNVGLSEGSFNNQQAAMATKANHDSAAFQAGDFKINGISIGATSARDDTASTSGATSSAISKAAAINRISEFTGVTAVVNENKIDGTDMTGAAAGSGTISINGVTTSQISFASGDSSEARRLVVDAINAKSGQTGVTAVDTGNDEDGVKLVAADGRNIVVSFSSGITAAASGVASANSYRGSVTLQSATSFTIEAGNNGDAGVDRLGLGVGTFGGARTGQALEDLDFTTAAGATEAISALDNAIKTVNSQRSMLGAVQNRFNSTISNLQTQSDNLSASRSRIQDADFATETAKMTKAQILQQAGTAMLAQANQMPQQVLQLLG